MGLEPVLTSQGGGMFDQSKTLKIEERNFVFRTPVPGGSGVDQHEYSFYLVVRTDHTTVKTFAENILQHSRTSHEQF